MIRNHCRHCTDRVVGCHSTCEKYKKYKEEMDKIHKEKEKDALLIDQRYRGIFRQTHKRRFFYSKGVKYKY